MHAAIVSLTLCFVSYWGEDLPAPSAPQLSMAQAARLYRIEVYNAFRHDRAEFNRRRELGETIVKLYEGEEQPAAEREVAIAWFVAAREATLAGAPLPEFSGEIPEAIPVITSGKEEIALDAVSPAEVSTSLDITLPKQAVDVGPSRFFSSLVRAGFRSVGAVSSEETDETNVETVKPEPAPPVPAATLTPPVKVELPATPITIKTPAALPTPPAVEEDPFAVKNLFEPAITPVKAKPSATNEDPFK